MKRLYEREEGAVNAVLGGLRRDPFVRKMKQFVQHGRVSTYEHGMNVARAARRINRRLRLGADERTLLRGALLHDFYLYDWHEKDASHRLHGFHHADAAARNAARLLGASERECEIIRTHMWPLTLRRVPRSREAWIVCFADKWCSLLETLFGR